MAVFVTEAPDEEDEEDKILKNQNVIRVNEIFNGELIGIGKGPGTQWEPLSPYKNGRRRQV